MGAGYGGTTVVEDEAGHAGWKETYKMFPRVDVCSNPFLEADLITGQLSF